MEFNPIVSYFIYINEEINWFFQLLMIIIIELYSKIYSVRDSCVYYGGLFTSFRVHDLDKNKNRI